jgi:hypothetical protein
MSAVNAYLESLPDDDRKVLTRVMDTIRKNLPKGYE